jgi:uncharacterized membrane protein
MSTIFDMFTTKSWEESVRQDAVKRGREEGANGRPTADTPRYDVGETHVRNLVQKQLVDVQQKLAAELQKILPTITKQDGELGQAELTFQSRQTAESLAQSFDGIMANSRADLEDAQYRLHETEGHFRKFKLDNNVTIEPDHPKDRLNYISIIFLVLAAETVLNAIFWGQKFGENFSLGIGMAFVISLINIAIGFVGGVLFSYKNLANKNAQLLGWIGLAVAILLAASVNFYVISRRPGDPAINAAMFCLGMAFSMFAAYKGYRFFGSVPGYAAASSSFTSAQERIKQLVSDTSGYIGTETRKQQDLRNGQVRKVGEVQVYFAKVRAELKNLQTSYRIAVRNLNTVLENSVGAYRANNRATKGALTPSPTWFDDPVEKYSDESASLEEAMCSLERIAARADSMAVEMHEEAKRENAELEAVKTSYVGIRWPQFVDTSNRSAHARFIDSLNAVGNKGRQEVYS